MHLNLLPGFFLIIFLKLEYIFCKTSCLLHGIIYNLTEDNIFIQKSEFLAGFLITHKSETFFKGGLKSPKSQYHRDAPSQMFCPFEKFCCLHRNQWQICNNVGYHMVLHFRNTILFIYLRIQSDTQLNNQMANNPARQYIGIALSGRCFASRQTMARFCHRDLHYSISVCSYVPPTQILNYHSWQELSKQPQPSFFQVKLMWNLNT